MHGQLGRRHRTGRVARRWPTPRGGTAWVDAAEIAADDEAVLAGWLADPDRRKVLHDAKGPMLALAARGWPLRGLAADTALSAYLSHPDQRSYDLADLTLRYLHRELKTRGRCDRPADLRPRRRLGARPGVDAEGERRRRPRRAPWRPSSPRAAARACSPTSSCPLVDVLAKMEQAGIAIDIDHLTSLEAQFAGRVKQAADDAYAVIGKQINLGSPKQLQVVLFEELGMPKTKRTKTGYTTDAEALAGSLREDRAPVPPAHADPPRRHPAAADRRGPAQDRRRRRPHPHDVQPDDRGDRPAVVDRAQPAEHPDPHRGGPPHP